MKVSYNNKTDLLHCAREEPVLYEHTRQVSFVANEFASVGVVLGNHFQLFRRTDIITNEHTGKI